MPGNSSTCGTANAPLQRRCRSPRLCRIYVKARRARHSEAKARTIIIMVGLERLHYIEEHRSDRERDGQGREGGGNPISGCPVQVPSRKFRPAVGEAHCTAGHEQDRTEENLGTCHGEGVQAVEDGKSGDQDPTQGLARRGDIGRRRHCGKPREWHREGKRCVRSNVKHRTGCRGTSGSQRRPPYATGRRTGSRAQRSYSLRRLAVDATSTPALPPQATTRRHPTRA